MSRQWDVGSHPNNDLPAGVRRERAKGHGESKQGIIFSRKPYFPVCKEECSIPHAFAIHQSIEAVAPIVLRTGSKACAPPMSSQFQPLEKENPCQQTIHGSV